MKKRLVVILFALLALTLAGASYAPRFLAYSDVPVKSDAVILFVGENFKDRKTEAFRLLKEGYARVLIVPSFREVIIFKPISKPLTYANGNPNSRRLKTIPYFYEKTHAEMLYARQMMDNMGLRSAIMVSSAYHMERIRMISEKVFGDQSRFFSYVPTPYENDPIRIRAMDWRDWTFVIQELTKICWFRLYSLFIN